MLATHRQRRIGAALCLVALVAAVQSLSGCGLVTTSPPPPTPGDFQDIAAALVQRGVRIEHIVSGDAGCPYLALQRTAIGLDAFGLDQQTPARIYFYIFRDQAAFDRLRQAVDMCAQNYAADPETFESIEAPPFVAASAGPWAREFRAAVRAALASAAGAGD